MNTIGEVLNLKKAVCREFNINEIHEYIAGSGLYRITWAFEEATIALKNKAYRFTVNGHHHKGFVYIVLDFMDTFTIYYTDKKDVIQKISKDVYIMDLIDRLDKDIEYISDYVK